LKNTCLEPVLERFESVSRAMIVGKLLLEIWHDALGAINRPNSQGLLVGLLHQREHFLVVVCDGESCFSHDQSPQAYAPLQRSPPTAPASACVGAQTHPPLQERRTVAGSRPTSMHACAKVSVMRS